MRSILLITLFTFSALFLFATHNQAEEIICKQTSGNQVVQIQENPPSYIPLVVENATWILHNGEEDFTINTYSAYQLKGDTILKDILYKKLYSFELERLDNGKFYIQSQQLAGFLREETATKKVYGILFRPIFSVRRSMGCYQTNEESLVFDFNKQIGEQLEDCHVTLISEEPTIVMKDTIVNIFGQDRRVLSTEAAIQLIEGVGYNMGLFLPPTSARHAGHGYGMIDYCVGINEACNLLVDSLPVSTKEIISFPFTLFPSPATDFLHLNFETPFEGVITLFNISGIPVYTATLNQTSHEINIKDFAKGAYFLYFQNEQGGWTEKVMIH